jgi:hypothetical protein
MIEFGSPSFENCKRRRGRTRRFVRFLNIVVVQIGQISAIRRSSLPASSAISRRPITRLALGAARSFERSSATSRAVNKPCARQNSTKVRQVPTIATLLSRRKSAIVLKSGASRRKSHITSRSRKHCAPTAATTAPRSNSRKRPPIYEVTERPGI